ncbi:putative bifunctional diguanylate cyclase/phosphodiesterase [Flavisphingomonas formosensis]|uniref:putative bifunctional diguanylate cyclase/phosphodiesterase n=1 Tax=Flavisphingomonas formosensis TaxID=861534 RepID=UPI001E5829CD|nr:bifunctional diguanylate cyclase/phosphodiesterase [Sphingomonas formosensis]
MSSASTPIFILSFRHRDELAGIAERLGWKPIAARRTEAAERRFVASGANIAVVDARGALDEGLAAVQSLADAVEANAAALLVLFPRRSTPMLDAFFSAGATHYLTSPYKEAEFAQSLRFAARYAERLAGGRQAIEGRTALIEAQTGFWRWQINSGRVTVSETLAERFGLALDQSGTVPIGDLRLLVGEAAVDAAWIAMQRLLSDHRPTAFAHDFGGEEGIRIAHHLHLEDGGQTIVARVEELDAPSSARLPRSRDPLTGLDDGPSARRWMGERIADGAGMVLLLVAISRFDMINAAFGRSAGDALLQGVARRIERMAGSGRQRLIAHMAGAEFAIGLPAPATTEEAGFLARRVVEAIERPFAVGDHLITLSCRIGIAAAEGEGDDASALLRRASAALADAKAGEGDAIRTMDAAGIGRAETDSRLEIDLRLALDQDEIGILFQPQVSVTTGEITGVEALARWRHPRMGELGAPVLFAAAARSDFLVPLSAHVQRKAVTMAARWPAPLAALRLSVNVTAADIARPDFVEHFLAMVDESGMDRGRLTVEVTESGLIEDLNAAAGLLARLRASGLRVAIDDFGTGYSSLAYLKALPLDYLKIDKRLAEDITGSPRDRVVVRGVIEMARSLGLAVVAEGVETEEQLALLAREGCNYYQGFLCAPPVDAAKLENLVKERNRAAR